MTTDTKEYTFETDTVKLFEFLDGFKLNIKTEKLNLDYYIHKIESNRGTIRVYSEDGTRVLKAVNRDEETNQIDVEASSPYGVINITLNEQTTHRLVHALLNHVPRR